MNSPKILIVEDDQIIALDILNKLENLGYIVVGIARSGKEGIEYNEIHKPDLILMDIILTGNIDGIETAEAIKGKYTVPILFLTALTDEKTFKRTLSIDPQAYIIKPISEINLKFSIELALNKNRTNLEFLNNTEKYRNLSLTDSLTGLYNRRGFYSLTKQRLKNADWMKNIAIIFYADLDGLKMINDKFGHSVGDLAIIDISKILIESFRDTDIIARIGGDEFLIFTLESSSDIEDIIITRINKTVKMYNEMKKYEFELSISIGSVNFEIKTDKSIEEYIKIADKKMYEVKKKKNFRAQ